MVLNRNMFHVNHVPAELASCVVDWEDEKIRLEFHFDVKSNPPYKIDQKSRLDRLCDDLAIAGNRPLRNQNVARRFREALVSGETK